jgi:hypothetical protein
VSHVTRGECRYVTLIRANTTHCVQSLRMLTRTGSGTTPRLPAQCVRRSSGQLNGRRCPEEFVRVPFQLAGTQSAALRSAAVENLMGDPNASSSYHPECCRSCISDGYGSNGPDSVGQPVSECAGRNGHQSGEHLTPVRCNDHYKEEESTRPRFKRPYDRSRQPVSERACWEGLKSSYRLKVGPPNCGRFINVI